jgi:cholesterol oxidase
MYEHDQLNLATHDALHELFGDASMSAFEQVSKVVREQHAVRADGTSYLRGLDRLAFPILFIHGGDAATFLPESTERTVAALREANDRSLYRQVVIPDYGALDCVIGKNAATDVFPHILDHLGAGVAKVGI